MNVHGFELIGDWKPANRGYTALATKGGKKYFLKKYGDFKLPRRDASTSDRLYAKLEREFKDFMDNRVAINLALKELAGPGGNIILPLEWFVDDIYYIEATEFVNDLIEDESIMALPKDDILFIMLTAAGALYNVHRKGIVHSDLKRTNLLAARNSAHKPVGKLIDFDKSYFTTNIREDELGGDQSFMSPELANCIITDLSEVALSYLSVKSDIFSLGLIFHNYLTGGKFPEVRGLTGAMAARAAEGKTVYCGEGILCGGELVVSKDIDPYLANLICNMLQLQPEDRPTALDVIGVLRDKKMMDVPAGSKVYVDGAATASATAPTPTPEPAPAPAPTPAPAPARPAVPSGFCTPLPEHNITFKIDKLTAAGYVAAEHTVVAGTSKGYKFYKADGTSKVMLPAILKLTGFASAGASADAAPTPTPAPAPAPEVIDDGTLWEEHEGFEYDMDAIKASGYTSAAKTEKNGIRGYSLIKPSGEQRFVAFQAMKLLGFIKSV